ncbi:MAG: ABC transporter permease [Thermomicrobiales bacterium]
MAHDAIYARRLILLLPVLLIVGIIVFVLVHLTPGDPAVVILGQDANQEQIDNLRDQLGLNDPLYVQFVNWFAGVLRLDFGDSIFLNMPVTEALFARAQPTLLLTLYALIIQIVIGITFGVLAAVRHNTMIDRVLMVISISGAAIPNFFLGILLILFFAVRLGWMPSGGFTSITEDPAEHFKSMVMPAFALGSLLGGVASQARAIVYARRHARRLRMNGTCQRFAERVTVVRHALRNALIPAITVIGFSLGALLGGAVVTETVFTIPGMGRLVVQSVQRRDYPVIQGAVMLIATFYVLANLLVDILYVYIDPRIRYGND